MIFPWSMSEKARASQRVTIAHFYLSVFRRSGYSTFRKEKVLKNSSHFLCDISLRCYPSLHILSCLRLLNYLIQARWLDCWAMSRASDSSSFGIGMPSAFPLSALCCPPLQQKEGKTEPHYLWSRTRGPSFEANLYSLLEYEVDSAKEFVQSSPLLLILPYRNRKKNKKNQMRMEW